MIRVEKIDNTTFRVTVTSSTTTTHSVTVSEDYHQKLTGGDVPAEKLV
jgi:hypothetical protein